MTRLILLDRDGVINVDSPHYVRNAEEWLPIPGAMEAIALLKSAGMLVGVCTNQSGIGRGILDEGSLGRIHNKLTMLLADRGASLDALEYCPHHPEAGCGCRKPKPGMLIRAMNQLGVAPSDTLFVGDSLRDMQAAKAAGCAAALVLTGKGRANVADAVALGVTWVAEDLAAVARKLLREASS
jgi:D-glycero-D-manno-heptose 1,7-bisphosphate phosphatase